MRYLLLGLLLVPTVASADPLFDRTVAEQSDGAATEVGARWYRADQPQALRRALVDTTLLLHLNRFRAAPKKTDGTLDPDRLARLGVLDAGGRRYAFAFDDEGLTVALARIAVPVTKSEGEGWSKDRFSRRAAALKALEKYRLKPIERDEYGNVFAWAGRAKAGRVFVRYVPADDELCVLYVRG